jgi:hypothetical protein
MATVYSRTLQRAAELVGGEEELALRLNVPPIHLAIWIRDFGAPPADVFLMAADIVSEHELKQIKNPPTLAAGDPA